MSTNHQATHVLPRLQVQILTLIIHSNASTIKTINPLKIALTLLGQLIDHHHLQQQLLTI